MYTEAVVIGDSILPGKIIARIDFPAGISEYYDLLSTVGWKRNFFPGDIGRVVIVF